LAGTQNPWRTEDARLNDLRANRLANSEKCSATITIADLENLSSESSRSDRRSISSPFPPSGCAFLFVFLVIEHRRREVLHFNVTEHPTSAWVAQQIIEAFAERGAPRYLIRDRDGVYGNEVRRRLEWLGIAEVLTAPQSPWQNAYVERLIGSIRRECLNHFIVLNALHLKRTLAACFCYYHRSRPHLALDKQCPIERQIMNHGVIVEIPGLGGLHHRYEPIAG
jgi:putative transposase